MITATSAARATLLLASQAMWSGNVVTVARGGRLSQEWLTVGRETTSARSAPYIWLNEAKWLMETDSHRL